MGSLAVAAASRKKPQAESYAYRKDNDFLSTAENPLSTFAADVDTASYANVRRMLRAGHKPPADAVRVEEWVNYFPYRYAAPKGEAFAASLEVAEAPWAVGHRLVRIGLKAREVTASERGAANLVFLVDVSASMDRPERLPLVKESLRLLVNRLRPDDRVAIVTYAGASGLALASTPVAQAREIVAALEAMTPGGATNGGMGIRLAYDIAKANFVTGGVNRVILCTDGDFNVGVTGEGELVRLVQEKAKSGVFLTVLGFGMGNFKDSMLEAIADKGNGSYGYIDSRREAEKLLGAQVNGTLTTVAKDVKLQVEFNPARVASYRLIGYENRLLAKEDFNNDKVDAGEIGAGHTMTALYEVVPTSQSGGGRRETGRAVNELKYSRRPGTVPLAVAGANGTSNFELRTSNVEAAEESTEFLTVKVRYKEPTGDVSRKLEFTLTDAGARFADASGDFKFASAVAAFGMILRNSPHKGTVTLNEVATWAEEGAADDPGGWRGEFVELARVADNAR
ncbi:MAG: VWA domain-containing protein [Undibacterium sp.]|nr:VWA domain-containing protein [Opitutaceae bacterium]